jgi:hypothetical protein
VRSVVYVLRTFPTKTVSNDDTNSPRCQPENLALATLEMFQCFGRSLPAESRLLVSPASKLGGFRKGVCETVNCSPLTADDILILDTRVNRIPTRNPSNSDNSLQDEADERRENLHA